MSLAEAPIGLLLLGLVAYAVLGGADFGAGFWQLRGGDRRAREHAYHAMGPVWEANHVWLIFVLVVCWTAYPRVFGSIGSTLSIPLFVAAIGIILRGTAYALRAGAVTLREERRVEVLFALSSILTPFALGAVVGGIASGRVPLGNAKGDLVTSWLNPTSLVVGAIAVASAAYLAAVYLAGDAVRAGAMDLARTYRARALAAGVAAGAIALAGVVVVHEDAQRIWHGLVQGAGLAALAVSGAAGAATLALVYRNRFAPARLTATIAVAAIVGGWAAAQRPYLLPGVTVNEAAAARSTIVALLVSVAFGAVVLFPSLGLLFGLFLRGKLDYAETERTQTEPLREVGGPGRTFLVYVALTGLIGGTGLTVVGDAAWTLGVGVLGLFVFIVAGFLLITLPPKHTVSPE